MWALLALSQVPQLSVSAARAHDWPVPQLSAGLPALGNDRGILETSNPGGSAPPEGTPELVRGPKLWTGLLCALHPGSPRGSTRARLCLRHILAHLCPSFPYRCFLKSYACQNPCLRLEETGSKTHIPCGIIIAIDSPWSLIISEFIQ